MTYLMYDKETKLYKIGITKNDPKKRRKQINYEISKQTGSDDYISRIKLLQVWKYPGMEKKAHELLKSIHVEHHPIKHAGYTEWFKLSFIEVRKYFLNKPYTHVIHYLKKQYGEDAK